MGSVQVERYSPVGSDRSALSALRPMGFSSPPSEPDVHLSLCIRLSKGFRKVRRPHPIERKPHHRDLAHLVLLNAALGPGPRAGILLPKGVIAFLGSGITENLVDKAKALGIPVMRAVA